MDLKDLQIAFKNFITDQSPVKFTAIPMNNLNIYKKNYFNSMTKALSNKFPVTLNYISHGKEKLFYEFIITHPSISPDINDYGEEFIKFLDNNNFAVAAALAQIDLKLFQSDNTSYEKRVKAEELKSITPNDFDSLKFSLSQSLHLSKVNAKTFKIWAELSREPRVFKEITSSSDTEDICIAIYLIDSNVTVNVITYAYYVALENIILGQNLLKVIEKALEIDQTFNLREFLGFCFKNALIINYELTV